MEVAVGLRRLDGDVGNDGLAQPERSGSDRLAFLGEISSVMNLAAGEG